MTGLSDDRTNLSLAGITTTYGQKLDWFGTARGRIGIANGPVLSYVTAGYAFGNVKTDATQSVGGLTSTFSTDRTQSGWVVGSGVEAALGGNWTGKIEYLYLNLGNKTDATTLLSATPINTEIRENIFRVGLNYRIGGNGLCAGRRRQLGRVLPRRQFRVRHRARSQLPERTGRGNS